MEAVKRIANVRNARGTKVKRCCLSCQHKDYDYQGCRICTKMMIKVEGKFRCPSYQMSDGHKLAGIGWGRVKSKEYLKYVKDTREDETEAIQMGRMVEKERKTLLQIRQEYMENNGSIYCIQ